MPRSSLRAVALLATLLLAALPCAQAQDGAPYLGRSVRSVIDELRAAGIPLAYSDRLVPEALRVASEPASREPLARLREVLAPHGLALERAGDTWLVVRAAIARTASVIVRLQPLAGPLPDGTRVLLDAPGGRSVTAGSGAATLPDVAPGRHVVTVEAPGFLTERTVVVVEPGTTAEVSVWLAPMSPRLDELTVTASRYDLVREVAPSTAFFSRAEIESLSDFNNDVLRVAQRLPGTAALEFSSRSHIRGGAEDEMTVLFDGVELVAPFHLEDYQSVFSAIDDRVVAGIQVYSGGFPAAYGGALSGLMLVEPRSASAPLEHELGLSLLYTSVLSSGTFADGRGAWVGSFRRGNADVLLKEEEGNPAYRDAYAHLALELNARHRLGVNGLSLDDDIRATPRDAPTDTESVASDVHSRELWLRLDSDWSDDLSSSTRLHTSRYSNLRRGVVADEDDVVGAVADARHYDALALAQDWQRDSGDQLLAFGYEWRRVEASFDYTNALELRGPLAALRPAAPALSAASVVPDGQRYGAYVSDRVRITSRAIVDLGLRWDRQSYVGEGGDDQWSPRSSFLYRLGARTDLRVSYGRFFQTERLLDLQIEDGVLEYADAQNATHSIVGVEHRFDRNIAVRGEAFRKWTRSARPRYENLFDRLALLPELRADRVRIAPDRAEVRGVEVFVSGEQPVAWWLGYSFSEAEDVFGAARVPRSWDQRRAVSGAVTWQAGPWTLSSVLTAHSGWPTTELALQITDGVPEAVAGPRNAQRLPSVLRLDFSAGREFTTANGAVRLFSEVTNVTNRDNPCCVRYEAVTSGGATALVRSERRGLPLIANVGVLWSF